jgi:hypothetical protein
MDRKKNPIAHESMQISNPHGHHIYKKSEECIFKGFKIVLHTFDANLNHMRLCVQAPLKGRKLNPRAPESMQMSNPRGHHTYKKSEARIFKSFNIVLHI